MQVPNQALMSSDIVNVSQSLKLMDRFMFQVDMQNMTPDLCDVLAAKLLEAIASDQHKKMFASDYLPKAYISAVADPLKYTVRLPHLWWPG
jgi:hypothetical protein